MRDRLEARKELQVNYMSIDNKRGSYRLKKRKGKERNGKRAGRLIRDGAACSGRVR